MFPFGDWIRFIAQIQTIIDSLNTIYQSLSHICRTYCIDNKSIYQKIKSYQSNVSNSVLRCAQNTNCCCNSKNLIAWEWTIVNKLLISGSSHRHCSLFFVQIHTKSCISFCIRTMAFRDPMANTQVSISSSFMVTLICYRRNHNKL